MSGGVLLYVDAKSVERNDAYEAFSAACELLSAAAEQHDLQGQEEDLEIEQE